MPDRAGCWGVAAIAEAAGEEDAAFCYFREQGGRGRAADED